MVMNKREKKKSVQEVITEVTEPVTVVETIHVNDIRTTLDEIKTLDGIIGYILRNETSAAIDLKDPSKIVDYAILSSSALDSIEDLVELFDLGNAKGIVIEGKDVKMVSVIAGANRVSVFMEKNADSERILKKLHIA
jgi:predicted regulator of Ras-like GTPase activity (Roadblock/LC7/MglB family)